MTWGAAILAALRLVEAIMTWANARKLIRAGQDAEIARASAAILAKTASAKRVMDEVYKLSGADLDKLFDELERTTASPDIK